MSSLHLVKSISIVNRNAAISMCEILTPRLSRQPIYAIMPS